MNGRPTLIARVLTPLNILILAVFVRLAFVLSQGNRYYFGDTREYEEVAERILHGRGLGTTPRAPLFPLEMAVGFRIGGEHNYLGVRVLQILFSVALVAVVMRIADRIAGRPTAVLAGLACALFPTLVFITGLLYPTTLYTLLVAIACLLALEMSRHPHWAKGAALGVTLTLGWLADPVMLAPATGLLAWLALQIVRSGRRFAVALAVTVLVVAALVVPYSRYQRIASGGKTVFMQKAQYTLHYSRTDSTLADGRLVRLPPSDPYVPLPMQSFLRREFGLFRARPAAYLHDVGQEFLHFFQPMPDRIQTQNKYNQGPVLLVGALTFLPVLLLAPVGLFVTRVRRRERGLLLVIVLAQAVFYSLFFTQTRYRIPVEPQMILLATMGLLKLIPGIAKTLGDDPRQVDVAEPR